MSKLKLTILIAFVALTTVCAGITYFVVNTYGSSSGQYSNLLEQGAAAELNHNLPAAKKAYADAALQAKHSDLPSGVCRALRKLAAIEIAEGKLDDGVANLRRAITETSPMINASAAPQNHEETLLAERAMVLSDLSSTLEQLKNYKEADEACMQAISIASEAHGPSDMQEGLMVKHEQLLEKMGRSKEAGKVGMARDTTYRDFKECYNAGMDEFGKGNLDQAKKELLVACAIAKRTHAGSRLSALTFLSLSQMALGETQAAAQSIAEAEPLYKPNDGWPDERARFFLAKAFSTAAKQQSQQVQTNLDAAFKIALPATRDCLQRIAWNADARKPDTEVCRAIAILAILSCGSHLSSDRSAVVNLALPTAHINLSSDTEAELAKLIKIAVDADRAKTLDTYVSWLVDSHNHAFRNSEVLLKTAESLKLTEPPNIDERSCLQILIWEGHICHGKRQYARAEKLFEKALATLSQYKLPDKLEQANYYTDSQESLANVYRELKRYPEAQRCLQEAWSRTPVQQQVPKHEPYAWRGCALADVMCQQNKYAEAESVLTTTLCELERLRQTKDFNLHTIAEVDRRIAELEARKGNSPEAIRHWQEAAVDFKLGKCSAFDIANAAYCDSNVANTYDRTGKLKDAEEWWQRCLKDTDTSATDGIDNFLLRSLWYANLLQRDNEFSQSAKVLTTALDMAQKHRGKVKTTTVANLVWSQAKVELHNNAKADFEADADKARALFQQAISRELTGQEQSDTKTLLAQVSAECASLCRDQKDFQLSEVWWKRSLEDSDTSTMSGVEQYMLRAVWYAQTMLTKNDPQAAAAIATRAMALASNRTIKAGSPLANLHLVLARASLAQGMSKNYSEHMLIAFKLFEAALQTALHDKHSEQAAQTRLELAAVEQDIAFDCRDRQHRLSEAEKWWRQSIDHSSTSTTANKEVYLYRTLWYAQTFQTDKRLREADETVTKAISIAQSAKQPSLDKVLAFLYSAKANIERDQHSADAPAAAGSSWKQQCKEYYLKARDLFVRAGDYQSASTCERAARELSPV